MISHVRDDSDALDMLLQLLRKAGESTHNNEVTELLAHASVKDGKLARARDLYQMLATSEPQNLVHMQNCQQVMGRMAGGSPAIGITAEEGAVIVEELEATAPVIDQNYPDQSRLQCARRSPMRTCFFPIICRKKRSCRCWASASGAARRAPEPASGRSAYSFPALRRSCCLLPHAGKRLSRRRVPG